MKFRPLQDRILVKRVDSESKTAGGIIIPNSAQDSRRKAWLLRLVMASVSTMEHR